LDKNLALKSIPKEDSVMIPLGMIASKHIEIEINMASKITLNATSRSNKKLIPVLNNS
jgi:hypothetical protein